MLAVATARPTMRAMVADLSDQDMEDIAAYYGAETVTTAGNQK